MVRGASERLPEELTGRSRTTKNEHNNSAGRVRPSDMRASAWVESSCCIALCTTLANLFILQCPVPSAQRPERIMVVVCCGVDMARFTTVTRLQPNLTKSLTKSPAHSDPLTNLTRQSAFWPKRRWLVSGALIASPL
jgi:hypothetical protein